MQTLEIISVNLWQILISLCNLLVLFLILKMFLFKPVKKVIAQREAALAEQYDAASAAQEQADKNKDAWEQRLAGAKDEADALIVKAGERAERKGEKLIEEAREKAEGIVRSAKTEAEAERKRVEAELRAQIADVSTLLAEKLIGREITEEDHKNLIDSFLDEIGENNDAGK